MSIRDWPEEALEALIDEKKQCPHGCGDCTNAAWGSTDNVGDKQRFHVIACAVGINLQRGEALRFCPFRNVDGLLKSGAEMSQDRGSKGSRQVQRLTP